MYLCKKIIFCIVVIVVGLSFFSGCILGDLFGGSFSLKSWSVCDDDGFASLSLFFSNTGTVTIKIFGPEGDMLDSDLFFKTQDEDHNAVLHLSAYRESVTPGQYMLRAYGRNDNKIFEESFYFGEPDLSISSCDQKWWKKQGIAESGYLLLGLDMEAHNNGDTPVYPDTIEMTIDDESLSGVVLPSVVLPGESKHVDCFVYKDNTPEDSAFTVSLKDIFGHTLATSSFSVVLKDNVESKNFTWSYGDINRQLTVPYPDFLFDYYSGVDRIYYEDYSTYVFDIYDDGYLSLFKDRLMRWFYAASDVDRINFASSFVQNLEYKLDSETNDSFEYPRYPVETLFNGDGGGDCEDLSILAASILDQMDYDVALFRLPNHMAVGVYLSESVIPGYEYYTDNYYFLETTRVVPSCGYVPNQHRSPSELTVYSLSSRPLLLHNWENGTLAHYINTELGDIVKVTFTVENLGSDTAYDILAKGGFYTQYEQELNAKTDVIPSLEPGAKEKVMLSANIPQGVKTWFKTRVYLDNNIVDEKESNSTFP